MKKLLFLPLLAFAACSPNKAFVKAMDKYRDAVAPEYEKYVLQGQPIPTWTDEEKAIRIETLRSWKALIEEASDE